MTQTHELKTLSRYFQAVKRGEKTFEVRKNDRAFQTGDLLLLREVREDFMAGSYTDATLTKRVTYLLQGGQFGIEPAYCILGLGDPEAA